MNQNDASGLVGTALIREIQAKGCGIAIKPNHFKDRLERLARDFFKQLPEKRTYVTSLSVKHNEHFPSEIMGQAVVPCTRADFPYPPQLIQLPSYVRQHITDSQYQHYAIETEEVTQPESMEVSRRFASLLSGILNFVLHFGSGVWDAYSMVPAIRRLASVYHGPVRTIHEKIGHVSSMYEYVEDYSEDAHCTHAINERIRQSFDWVVRRVVECGLPRIEFEDLIVRYADAVEETNVDQCFLSLWNCLESITGTSALRGYDSTIARAIWLFSDKPIMQEKMQSLRIMRNRLVHASQSSNYKFEYCQILRRVLHRHMQFLLMNQVGLKSFGEYAELLDAPKELMRIRAQMTKLRNSEWLWHGSNEDYSI